MKVFLFFAVTASLAAFGVGIARAQQVVGAVGAANAAPTGRAPGKAVRTLAPGGDVFFKDRIVTKRGGSAQLTFLDRSTLSVGENSELVIDEFVYRPGSGGVMKATLGKGILRFVGGDISHAGGATIRTPAVTIGIRGGIGMIGYVKDGAMAKAIPGVPADFHGGTVVVSALGTLTVTNGVSTTEISRPGFAVFVGSASSSIAAPVRFDMAAAQAMMKALTSKPAQHGGASPAIAAAAHAVLQTDRGFAGTVVPPQPPQIDALALTAITQAGNVLARTQSQAFQAAHLAAELKAMQMAPAPVTTIPTTPVTTTPVTTTPVASVPVTTTPITPVTTPVVSAPVTTTPTTPVTTPVASAPVTTIPTTPVTTIPVTTMPVTTPVATTPVTTTPVTTTPVTSVPVTTPTTPVTTPVVSAPVTTAPTTPVATPPVASTPVTTTPTNPVAAAPVASTPVATTPTTPVTSPPAMPVATTPAPPVTVIISTPFGTISVLPSGTVSASPGAPNGMPGNTVIVSTPGGTLSFGHGIGFGFGH